MSDSGDPYSNNAITVSEQFQSFLTDYQSSINVTDEQRENMMKKNGRTVLPSEELKVDSILKESHLLQYAMKNPREYINLRNTEITKIKKDVDLEFLKLFDQFTTGPEKLPQLEAKQLAFEGAENLMHIRMKRLDQVYPAKFENRAYENIINEQRAKQYLRENGIIQKK